MSGSVPDVETVFFALLVLAFVAVAVCCVQVVRRQFAEPRMPRSR